jgi:hypothetical protein
MGLRKGPEGHVGYLRDPVIEPEAPQATTASDPLLKADLFEAITVTMTRSDEAPTVEQRRAWAARLLPLAERSSRDGTSAELRYRAIQLLEVLAGYAQAGALNVLDEAAARDPRSKLRDLASKAAARMRLRPEDAARRAVAPSTNPASPAPAPGSAPAPSRPSEHGTASRSLGILGGGAVIPLVMLS